MSAPQETTQETTYTCGKCNAENPANAKFCDACGHHLTEPCSECGTTVALSQKFCGKCGANLEKSTQHRYEQYEKKLLEAIEKTKLHEYEHALALIEKLCQLNDYRFRPVAEQAATAANKINMFREHNAEYSARKII